MDIGVAPDLALHGVSAVLVDPVEAALTRARGELAPLARLGRLVNDWAATASTLIKNADGDMVSAYATRLLPQAEEPG